MNKAAIRRWVKALRSGKYKQCSGVLRKVDDGEEKFCAIGVLLDTEVDGWWINDEGYWFVEDADGRDIHAVDVISSNPEDTEDFYSAVDIEACVISMNDCEESFADIADRIERDYLNKSPAKESK